MVILKSVSSLVFSLSDASVFPFLAAVAIGTLFCLISGTQVVIK